MSNKVIKNWTHCMAVDTLSAEAEIFLTRLFMCVDPNGCFYANPVLLRANLFPLRIDTLKDETIRQWLAECENAGLLQTYMVQGTPYLHITGYQRKLKRKRDTMPTPPGFVEEEAPTVKAHDKIILDDKLLTKEERKHYRAYIDWRDMKKPDWLTMSFAEEEEPKCHGEADACPTARREPGSYDLALEDVEKNNLMEPFEGLRVTDW